MTTKIQTIDSRTTNLTFEDIANGSMFTEKDYGKPYIKMPIFTLVDMAHRYDEEIMPHQEEEEEFNAVDLYGDPYWFDYDSEVESVNEIYITMK
jgi:hypothetical protein